MKTNKVKFLSVAVCCSVIPLLSETQGQQHRDKEDHEATQKLSQYAKTMQQDVRDGKSPAEILRDHRKKQEQEKKKQGK